jgi:hypothetical protein
MIMFWSASLISRCGEGWGCEKGGYRIRTAQDTNSSGYELLRIRTALVKSVARTISEAIHTHVQTLVSALTRFHHFKRVMYSNCWSGEICHPYGVLINLRKTGISAISGFGCKGSYS